jgi:hypothetical protein
MNEQLNLFHHPELPQWIDEAFEKFSRPTYVDGVLPGGYKHYFKLFFPVGLVQVSDHGRSVQKTYRELADLLGIKYTRRFSYTDLVDKFDGLPFDFTAFKKADPGFIEALIDVIGGGCSCTFYGPGESLAPPMFRTPWSSKGTFESVRTLLQALNMDNYHDFNFFPEYVFAEDQSWSLGNKVFQSGILLLGCGDEMAQRLSEQALVEFIPLKHTDEYIRLQTPKF